MSWYRTGTLTLTNGSTAVTGSGTAFIANAAAGEALLAPDGKFYEIAAVVSDTSLTLGSNYLGTTASGQAYTILPSQSFVRDLAAQAAALIQTYADIATGAGAGKFSAGTAALPGIAGSADTDTGINLAGSNVLNLVAGGATRVAVTTAGAAVTGTLAVTGALTTTGNTTLGDSTSADSHTVNGVVDVNVNTATSAFTITQTGTGNAFVVEDSASPDATPFVIDAAGRVINGHTVAMVFPDSEGASRTTATQALGVLHDDVGQSVATFINNVTNGAYINLAKSKSGVVGTHVIVGAGDTVGVLNFAGSDGTAFIRCASVIGAVDGTPGTGSMPGRLVFRTTPTGSGTPVEAMRITSGQGIQIARTAVTAPAASDGNVFSGTYTPTLTNTTNVAASTAFECQYMRVGNVVTVSGAVSITPTAANANTVIGISFPIASTIGFTRQCRGTTQVDSTVATELQGGAGTVIADVTNNRATMRCAPTVTTAREHSFTFTYRVI